MSLFICLSFFNCMCLVMRWLQKPGQLRVHSGGISWKKQGGGKVVEIEKADISRMTWMKVPRSYQLGVRIKDGLFYKFIGFREQVRVHWHMCTHMDMNTHRCKGAQKHLYLFHAVHAFFPMLVFWLLKIQNAVRSRGE